jgi:hypothetical protein
MMTRIHVGGINTIKTVTPNNNKIQEMTTNPHEKFNKGFKFLQEED